MLLVTRLSLIVINVNLEGRTVSILIYHIETEHEEPLSMCWNQDHKVTMHKGVQDSCDICDINSSGPGQLELTEGLNMKNVSTSPVFVFDY